MVYRINWNQRSERYSVIRPGRGWMMKPWTPCSEKSFNSRSIIASVISPFQTKNGRVLNSAGGFGNNVLRRARESTVVAAEAADKNINVTTRHFLISTGSLDFHQGNARQFTELPDQLAKMTDSQGAVVRRPLLAPPVHELPRSEGEP